MAVWGSTFTRTAIVTGVNALNSSPGDGLCVIIWDADYNFQPGGIGSSLGYTNYRGPIEITNETELNKFYLRGVQGGFLGIGFDISGSFGNSTDGKTFTLGQTTGLSGLSANTITVRGPALSAYQTITTTKNLSTFSQAADSAPPFYLHQFITDDSEIEFNSARISLRQRGKILSVDLKKSTEDKFNNYLTLDLNSYSFTIPQNIKIALAYSTSKNVAVCEIKNFNVYCKATEVTPTYNGHSGVWLTSAADWAPGHPYSPETYVTPQSSFISDD